MIVQGLLASYKYSTFPTSGLISYYKLDSNSNDSVGTNNGTDTAVSYVTGKIGNAISHTGATSKSVITENTSLALTEFSISFWFQVANTTGYKPIFRRSAAFLQGYAAYVNGSGVFGYIGNGADITTPSQTISSNTWYHGVLTWSNSTKEVSLTINNGTPQTQSTATNITNSGTLNLIYDVPNNITGATVILDEMGIWNRVLTAGEITTLYNGGTGITY